MVVSPYRTSVTAAHQNDSKRVGPDMTNRKALQKPARRAAWERRQAANKSA